MISIIVPLYNEASNLEPLTDRLYRASSQWQMPYEVIFVDDGSTDNSRSILKEIHQKHPNHRYLGLSRNFGHQSALCAGLSHARGEAVVLIDADLQDPPECISLLLAKWREGYHVVYGIRQHRKENFLKRASYWIFSRLLQKIANISTPLYAGDFCVLDRRVVDHLNALPERNRFMRGLRAWVGFSQIGVTYERQARFSGERKYTFRHLLKLAIDGLINFSIRPLQWVGIIGVLVSIFSFLGLLFYVILRIFDLPFWGHSPGDVPGFITLIFVILFASGIQMLALGILGLYLGRIFEEIKQRPLYIIEKISDE